MKNLISIFLIFVLTFSFSACSSDDNNDNIGNISKPQSTQSEKENDENLNFSETTVVDNENCSLKITDLKKKGKHKYEASVLCENKTEDKKYMFSLDSLAVNGLEINSLFASEVAAGKKLKDTISISDSNLEENEVGNITDIELTFRIYDSEDLMADDVSKETVNLYPLGENKTTKYSREKDEDDIVIVENESIEAVVIDFEDDDIWGYTAELYLVNKTDTELMFSADDVSVNGMMIDPLFAKSLKPNKSAFASISWSESSLKEAGISDFDDIDDIEMKLRVYDYNNILDDDIFNKTIKLNP